MNKAKNIAYIGVFVALLIGGQLALSGISGVEIVTILLLSFCFVFGSLKGIIVATIFSLLRCFIFGFYINIIILYLLYYNLFALFFGFIGYLLKREISLINCIIVFILVVVFTVLFTFMDDIITPLYYGFAFSAFKAYCIASIYTLIPHVVCSFISSIVLFVPLVELLKRLNKS